MVVAVTGDSCRSLPESHSTPDDNSHQRCNAQHAERMTVRHGPFSYQVADYYSCTDAHYGRKHPRPSVCNFFIALTYQGQLLKSAAHPMATVTPAAFVAANVESFSTKLTPAPNAAHAGSWPVSTTTPPRPRTPLTRPIDFTAPTRLARAYNSGTNL